MKLLKKCSIRHLTTEKELCKLYIYFYGDKDDPNIFIEKFVLTEHYEKIKEDYTLLKTFKDKILLKQSLSSNLECLMLGIEILDNLKNEIKANTNNRAKY